MARRFKQVDYKKSGQQTITLDEVLPPDHLARFIVGIIAELDLSPIYERYAARGGAAYAPEVLLGLLFYDYATGICSSRQIEQATYEIIPFRYIAGGWHPDHDTIAHFHQTFLPPITELFGQILLVAQEWGVLKLGNISLDGSKIHADAAKSKAVSYQRWLQLKEQLQAEVAELLARRELTEPGDLPAGLDVPAEVLLR